MTSPLNHQIVKQRQFEPRSHAEHGGLANEARRTRATSRDRFLGELLAMRRSTAARLAAGFGPADRSPSPASMARVANRPATSASAELAAVCITGANRPEQTARRTCHPNLGAGTRIVQAARDSGVHDTTGTQEIST
jgi:hypothetical protein